MSNHNTTDKSWSFNVTFRNELERSELHEVAALCAHDYGGRAAFWGAMMVRGARSARAEKIKKLVDEQQLSEYDV